MRWFQGSIPKAITTAKQVNGIFIVFVYDKTESSEHSRKTLNSDAIQEVLTSFEFVAIELENGSEQAKQFGQIYPLLVVPSIFFISGQSGVPLEVVAGKLEEKSLLEKIKNIVPVNDQNKTIVADETSTTSENAAASSNTGDSAAASSNTGDSAAASSNTGDIAAASSNTGDSAAASRPPTLGEVAEHKEIAQENPASTSAHENEPATPVSEGAASKESTLDTNSEETIEDKPSLDERVAKAKALLSEQQELKILKEQEEEKLREQERRRQSQDVVRAKQKREELERAEISKQRKKDKEEDRIVRERVKAQIAYDRAERQTRESLLRGDPPPPTQPSSSSPPSPPTVNRNRDDITRIKFRFPDNSSDLAQFASSSTLEDVRSYLTQNCSLPYTRFNLVATLPHRTFTEDQMSTTLSDLGLTPSAIIIVKPVNTPNPGSLVPSGDGAMQIFWSLIAPITFLLNYLRSILGFGDRRVVVADSSDEEGSQAKKRPRKDADTTKSRPKTAYGSRQDSLLRREGNIHRLNRMGEDDDDDDNNTWNGNSTQQM